MHIFYFAVINIVVVNFVTVKISNPSAKTCQTLLLMSIKINKNFILTIIIQLLIATICLNRASALPQSVPPFQKFDDRRLISYFSSPS